MDEEKLAKLREMLLEKRRALLDAIESLSQDSAASKETAGTSRIPGENADAASESLDMDTLMLSMESEDEFLRKVDAALAKIESGTYGICEECGKAVGDARLEALPFAPPCLACQKKIDYRRSAAEGAGSRERAEEEAEKTFPEAGEEAEE
ncbi:MAG: TraR/DksA C4-type zinc finger protein [Planctomycetota bacterium]|nr:TraR/DksA C4-type zinc finger protein [Planctomycetota bacterium]